LKLSDEVVFLSVEVFDLSFEFENLAVNAGNDISFGDLNVICAWGDFSFGGLGVDCGEVECAVVAVTDIADGDGGKVVECVDGDNHSWEGVVFGAVGFDEDFDSVTDSELGDLFSRAEVDFELCSVDFNDAGVGCGFHGVCCLLFRFNPLRGSVCLVLG